MPRQTRRTGSARSSSRGPLTFPVALPDGPVEIDTGVAKLERDPDHSLRVTLLVNGAPSSFVDLGDPAFLAFEYMQQMNCVLDQRPGPLRVLHLGAGACSLAAATEATHPNSRQVAVDIDARLVQLVRSWFPLPRAPLLKLRAQDAATAVRDARPDTYDVIVRDVFAGITTPRDLTTRDFAAEIYRALAPGGLYLANCADQPPLTLARRELAGLIDVFRDNSAHPAGQVAAICELGVLKGRRIGNVVLVASKPEADCATSPVVAAEADPWSLTEPALARALRSLPTPSAILTGVEVSRFVATAKPITRPKS